MPWPKRTTRGSCLFCHQEFTIVQFAQGDSWCGCQGADRHRKEIKNSRNRFYYLQDQAKKGLEVNHNQPRGEKDSKHYAVGYKRSQYRIAKHCGHPTKNNYFNCEACQARMETAYDLNYLIDDLDTKWNGVRI